MEKAPQVHRRYPKPVQNWGLPAPIDAAFQWENGKTYFFSNNEYYRFNDIEFKPQKDEIPYPRNSGVWWFGCQEEVHDSSTTIPFKYNSGADDYIENEINVGEEVLDVGDWFNIEFNVL